MKHFLFPLILANLMQLILGGSVMAADKLPEPFQVIPQPQNIDLMQGDGLAYGTLANLKMTGEFKRPVMGDILSQLKELDMKGPGTLTLALGENSLSPTSHEGYELIILNGHAEILASGEAGLFYGCQTLEQLLEDARDFHTPIPACKIIDKPALPYRSVQIDIKHHLDHMNMYYESIDRLARYKINAVIFEIEDKLRFQRQPLVAAPQSISIDEMAALTRYARERHIEITPLVQGLGHATFILKHEHYAPLRELEHNRWAFCPLDEGTYDVLFDMYSDAIDATPGSRYLHIGGDEIGNIGLCPRCKPTAEKEGELSLNLYWLKRVCEFAGDKGRIAIFWDDMPLKAAGVYRSTWNSDVDLEQATKDWENGRPILEDLIAGFPKNCVYNRWNYSMARQPGNIFALDWYRDNGLPVMIATAAQTGGCLFPVDDRDLGMASHGIAAIRSFNQLAAEKEVEGMFCTAWDDDSPHLETFWRGFIASAEYSWSPNGRTLDEYDEAYLQREYGASFPHYTHLYGKLRRGAAFWEKAFNREGIRGDLENALFELPGLAHWMPPKDPNAPVKTDFSDRLIELPDVQNPGSWSKEYEQRLSEAVLILDDYQATSKVLDSLYNCSTRNRYHWELFAAMNDFQVMAPSLLLALKQCDVKDRDQQLAGTEKVHNTLTEFERAWENLQIAYGQTRFLSYPSNYVPDRYFHFASQREDLTWMIQVEEQLHVMINSWIVNNQ
jgi:hexosaminidase